MNTFSFAKLVFSVIVILCGGQKSDCHSVCGGQVGQKLRGILGDRRLMKAGVGLDVWHWLGGLVGLAERACSFLMDFEVIS